MWPFIKYIVLLPWQNKKLALEVRFSGILMSKSQIDQENNKF